MRDNEPGDRIHSTVIAFHELGIEAVQLMHEGCLTRKDLQWLRADARLVSRVAHELLTPPEEVVRSEAGPAAQEGCVYCSQWQDEPHESWCSRAGTS